MRRRCRVMATLLRLEHDHSTHTKPATALKGAQRALGSGLKFSQYLPEQFHARNPTVVHVIHCLREEYGA